MIAAYSLNFLPKVGIVRQKGSGEADARHDKIYIHENFFKLKKNMKRYVLIHELAHIFQNMNNISILDLENSKFSIFEYESVNNPVEGFAEAFAVYVMKPSELKTKYPEQYFTIKNMVGKTSKIKDWAKIVVDNIKNLYKDQVYRLADFENMEEE